jgi:hypothetical protein
MDNFSFVALDIETATGKRSSQKCFSTFKIV